MLSSIPWKKGRIYNGYMNSVKHTRIVMHCFQKNYGDTCLSASTHFFLSQDHANSSFLPREAIKAYTLAGNSVEYIWNLLPPLQIAKKYWIWCVEIWISYTIMLFNFYRLFRSYSCTNMSIHKFDHRNGKRDPPRAWNH